MRKFAIPLCVLSVLFLGTMAVAEDTTDDVIWSGASGVGDLWEDGANWEGAVPPANPTPGTLTFTDTDSGGTNVLDDAVTTWTIGGLQVKNPETGTVADISHTTDLGGGRLIVAGDLTVGVYSTDEGLGNRAKCSVTFTNGTLQVGTPGNPVNLRLADAEGMQSGAELTMAPGTTFEAYLDLLQVGNTRQSAMTNSLDLRDVTIVGGTLKANTLDVGGGDSGVPGVSSAERDDGIRVNAGSNLQNIEVAGSFIIGEGDSGDWHTWGGGTSRFGDPDNNWKLPPDVNIKVGSKVGETINRGNIIIGKSHKPWGGNGLWGFGSLVASTGGTCEAYLDELVVGQVTWGYPNTAEGEFDIKGMDSCTIDVTNVSIGMRTPGIPAATWSDGIVYLPSGTVVADTMEIGDYADGATGVAVLGLNDTVFTVNNSVTVQNTALIDATVGPAPSGLDLGGTFDVFGAALINITFAEPPDGSASIHWGLRWLGDHVADLQALVDAGNLLWDDSGLGDGKTAGIVASGGYTYVAHEGPEVLDADVNGDCKVNILDLIAVRNHLNQDPTSPPENAIYDVTGDGKINILDLIYVRNRLNNTCEE